MRGKFMVTIFRQVLVTTSQHHKVHLTVFCSKPIIVRRDPLWFIARLLEVNSVLTRRSNNPCSISFYKKIVCI